MAAFEESAAPPPTPAQDFYTWTFPGAPVRIHLHLSVVESLGREVRRAFESVPSHSVEIGGILYGTADFAASPVIEIKDFEPFLCEYRADHKYILSDGDRRKLDRLLAARRADGPEALSVVGYYRSHIGDGLSMRTEDVTVAQGHFFDPANVFLLVKPLPDGSASAGFFFWDNRRIDAEFTYLEFPFDARQLTGMRVKPTLREIEVHTEPHSVEVPAPMPPPASFPDHFDALPSEPPRPRSAGNSWLLALLAVLIAALGGAGYEAYLKWGPGALSDTPGLALQVERKGADLRVSWNRNALAITQATEGVLSIRDGDTQQQELHLDPDQLRTGSVTYTPANPTVRFRMDVTAPGNTKITESVLALTAARPDSPGNSPPALGPSPQSDAAAATSPGHTRDLDEAARVAKTTGNTGVATQPKQELPDDPSVLYLPPRPTRQTQPVVPQAVRRLIATQIEVPVKVWIGSTGTVLKAEPQPTGQLVSSTLVEAAQRAALRWRFAPAVRGTETVPSEMVLRFQFKPAGR